ncbi:MAG: penicillin-binding protein, partial [Solirubrobacterales bacterium]|nr:penicillin-binding protein [Solirubrobacterales bacterium]
MVLVVGAVILALLAVGALSAVGWVISVAASSPDLSTLEPASPGGTSIVYAANGDRLGAIQADVLRTEINSSEMPETIKDATVAIEDRRFYEHEGVDFEGVVRAAVANLNSGETVEGGSTLTMQLVRTLYISNEQTFERKIREAKLAEELENVHSGPEGKKWILTKYLNSVPYGTVGGQTAVGLQAASRVFFNKTAGELELHESALLAGLPQAPTSYNPYLNPDRAKARRDQVLDAMVDMRMVTPLEAAEAKEEDLDVEEGDYYTKRDEEYFFEYVKQEMFEEYGVQTVRQGGLRIHTTIDPKLQREARKAMESRLGAPDMPSSAIVSIDPDTGYLKAMATTAEFGDRKFNLASDGKRQPGSAFKIMGLVAALDKGVDPGATTYTSKPLNVRGTPIKNYGNSYRGPITLAEATVRSDNSVFMQLALDLGPDKVVKAARKLGIDSKLNGYPSEILGGLERGVSPLEMANAYATIASGGWRNRVKSVTKVRFADGEEDDLSEPRRHKAFDAAAMYKATELLIRNMQSGTGTKAQIRCPAGGKTGTTDGNKDAWFVGFTPKLSTAVWVGYPDSNERSMSFQYNGGPVDGGTFPAEIWGEYMGSTPDKTCGGKFERPKNDFQPQPFNRGRGSGQIQSGTDFGAGGSGSDGFTPPSQSDGIVAPTPPPPDPAPPPPAGDT